jgi:hypothetical protein
LRLQNYFLGVHPSPESLQKTVGKFAQAPIASLPESLWPIATAQPGETREAII